MFITCTFFVTFVFSGGTQDFSNEKYVMWLKTLNLMRGDILTTDFERSLQLQKDWLAEKDLTGLDAEAAHLSLRHLDNFSWTTSSD